MGQADKSSLLRCISWALWCRPSPSALPTPLGVNRTLFYPIGRQGWCWDHHQIRLNPYWSPVLWEGGQPSSVSCILRGVWSALSNLDGKYQKKTHEISHKQDVSVRWRLRCGRQLRPSGLHADSFQTSPHFSALSGLSLQIKGSDEF